MVHYLNRRFIVVFALGFSSGLPLALCGGTLQAWYTVAGVDIVSIGLLTMIGLPYVYKFLWAPLIDRYLPPLWGRRRGWILITQLALIALLIAISLFSPQQHPVILASLAFLLAFLSASQDIVIDAYRTELLQPSERGLGAAFSVTGYRVAMIISGGVALILADSVGWRMTYLSMSLLMSIAIFATWWAPQPAENSHSPATLRAAVVEPFQQFLSRDKAYLLLAFMVLYKLGEAFTTASGSLVTTFLLRDLGFSLTTVGTINKGVGLVATLLGLFLGGSLLRRMSLYSALLWFGLLQAVSNLSFLLLAMVGKHYGLLMMAVLIDNLAAGLGMAAFIAFLMSICDKRYTATQFALFSALSAIGRVVLGPIAGVWVAYAGWANFFFTTFVLALPGLLVLKYLQEEGSLSTYIPIAEST